MKSWVNVHFNQPQLVIDEGSEGGREGMKEGGSQGRSKRRRE